jgi:hypothetical protein
MGVMVRAGDRLTAALVRSLVPDGAFKPSDQSVASSTTLTNDTALFFAVQAGAQYGWACYLDYEAAGPGTGDIKWHWTLPAGASIRYSVTAQTTAGAANVGTTYAGANTPTAGGGGAGNLQSVYMNGALNVSSTAGTMQLQWAQNSSSGTATIVHAQSYFVLWREP